MTLEQCEKGIKLAGRFISKELEKYDFGFNNQSEKNEREPLRCCGYYYYYFNFVDRNIENALACLNSLAIYLLEYSSLSKVEIPNNLQVYFEVAKQAVINADEKTAFKIKSIMFNTTNQPDISRCIPSYYIIMSRKEIPFDVRLAKVEGDSSNWPVDEKTMEDALLVAMISENFEVR